MLGKFVREHALPSHALFGSRLYLCFVQFAGSYYNWLCPHVLLGSCFVRMCGSVDRCFVLHGCVCVYVCQRESVCCILASSSAAFIALFCLERFVRMFVSDVVGLFCSESPFGLLARMLCSEVLLGSDHCCYVVCLGKTHVFETQSPNENVLSD